MCFEMQTNLYNNNTKNWKQNRESESERKKRISIVTIILFASVDDNIKNNK
jgi:hypothetical protein